MAIAQWWEQPLQHLRGLVVAGRSRFSIDRYCQRGQGILGLGLRERYKTDPLPTEVHDSVSFG
jgi:hypothetical protein